MRVMGNLAGGIICAVLWPGGAAAHVGQGSFVLLLPTGAYTAAGVAVVALTVAILVALPDRAVWGMFGQWPVSWPVVPIAQVMVSLAATLLLVATIWIGWNGPRDPLANLMPLGLWTLGWMMLATLCGVFGNLARWINPWSGVYRLIGSPVPLLRYPEALGQWPAAAILVSFAAFLLADIAPDDPARLAGLVALYWCAIMAAVILFGPDILSRIELGHAVGAAFGALAPLGQNGIGVPGWKVLSRRVLPGGAVFAVLLLAVGSFDGLNETFWWFGLIGVNPLEFPGRSAIVPETLLGLAATCLGLWLAFAGTVWLGLRLAGGEVRLGLAFAPFALSLLPIAFGYHIAHYLTTYLVNIQYLMAALTDPLAQGQDILGLGEVRVTTGFLNRLDTVRLIWLTQAGAVVIGHVWAVLLAHRLALDLYADGRRALRATAPLSAFMIGYTFLGLWLLAAAKGA